MNANKVKTAKYFFIANALLIGVAGGALMGFFTAVFAFDSGPHYKEALIVFSVIFFPLSLSWSLFCYGAYKGIKSDNLILKFIFWFFVLWNIITFPIGTIFAIYLIYLWREINKRA